MELKYTQKYIVSISDINYGGHVSNASILDYLQEGRIGYLKQLGNYSEIDIGSNTGLILAESNIKYLAEMFHGDILDIALKITNIKRSSLKFEYRIFRNSQITIEGSTIMVGFDYEKRKIIRLPEEFKSKIIDFEQI